MPLFIKVGSIPESRSSLSHSRTLMLLPESGAFSTIRTRRGRSAPSAVGARLVGYQQLRREALFLEQLAHQPQRCALVAPALNQHVEDFALVIDGSPQMRSPARDPNQRAVVGGELVPGHLTGIHDVRQAGKHRV